MARNVGNQIENAFTKALITEATGLNFPENACTDTLNCRFNQTGTVTRRFGFDYEPDYEFTNMSRERSVLTEYVWNSVAGTGNINFAVIQYGRYLKFYAIDDNGALSPGIKAFTVDLNTFRVPGAPSVRGKAAQFANGKGFLFVAHPYCDTFYVEYDIPTDTISTTEITVKIRDFEGVEDGLITDTRPGSLSKEHHYNLWNQGWYKQVDVENQGHTLFDPIQNVKRVSGTFPSNADVWWLWKNENEAFKPGDLMGSESLGNSPAAKGHYILDAFFQDRSAQLGAVLGTIGTATTTIAGLPVISSGYFRVKTIAFYAGRLWYAGVDATKFSSSVYYSQIIDDVRKAGHCYQTEDPTSETLSDLLDTDGGVIDILEIGNVYKLFTISSGLLVFASNGIWTISGQQGDSFKATNFSVAKVSSIPCISASSFVDAGGIPIWWNLDGIYTISAQTDVNKGQIGAVGIQSITDQTIKAFFDDISANAKRFAKGAYNPLSKEVQWLYKSVEFETDEIIETYNYDRVLVLNTLTGGFYPWAIDGTSGVTLNGILSTTGIGLVTQEEEVVDESGVIVVDQSGVHVVANVTLEKEFSAEFRYLSSVLNTDQVTWDFTFAQERDSAFVDWITVSPVDYESYLVTGFKIPGEAQRVAQIDYIVTYTLTQDNASCYLQLLWDYANAEASNRWGRLNQVYPVRPNYSVQQSRIMPRGSGRVCQMKYLSESGKPFSLIGWSLAMSVNAQA